MERRRLTFVGWVSVDVLRHQPTIETKAGADLKLETIGFRIWVERGPVSAFGDRPIPHGWPLRFERQVGPRWLPCDAEGKVRE